MGPQRPAIPLIPVKASQKKMATAPHCKLLESPAPATSFCFQVDVLPFLNNRQGCMAHNFCYRKTIGGIVLLNERATSYSSLLD